MSLGEKTSVNAAGFLGAPNPSFKRTRKERRAADLESVRFGPLVASARYTDFEDLWSPLPTGVGPAGAFCSALDEKSRAALRESFRERLQLGGGPFELTARAWAVAEEVRD